MILCSLISHAPPATPRPPAHLSFSGHRQVQISDSTSPYQPSPSPPSSTLFASFSRKLFSSCHTKGSTRLTSDLLKAPKKCTLGWPLCIPNDRMPWWRKWNPIKNHSRRDYGLYATNFPEIAPDSDSDSPPPSSKQIQGALKYPKPWKAKADLQSHQSRDNNNHQPFTHVLL